MELVVLGSGTGVPVPHRASAGYLLRADGREILLDCGPGTLRNAAAAGTPAEAIDAVIVSHFHPDHNLGLPALFFALRNPGAARTSPLEVVAPEGFREILEHWWAGPQGEWFQPRGYEFRLREIGEGEHGIQGLAVTSIRVDHTPQSLAYRIAKSAGGPVLAWSGDTAECDGIVEAGRDADLFLLECAVPDGTPEVKHLSPSAAGRVAALAAPKRLLLTHFYPEVEEEPILEIVGRHWPGPAELAEDGRTWRI